jgi:thiol-disulfide isomerase/thioredoxin
MLMKKLGRENIEYDYVSLFDEGKIDKKLYKKYNIKTTPVLLVFDKKEVADRLTSVEEIVEYLKNVSNTEI